MRLEIESNKKIERMNTNIIRALARTIDAKDRYTNGHSLRVADYSLEIAKRMNKTPEEQASIEAKYIANERQYQLEKDIENNKYSSNIERDGP